ncbi:MAG: RNA polymerase sigma factor [Planctomycetota bacterium]|jgi:RNA polymerase sigma factor (sigma-70 family)
MLDVDNKIETRERVKRAEDIFETYGDEIRAMISLNVKEQSRADDVFQNLFLSVVHKPIPTHVERIEAYLYRIITNDIIDETRKTNGYHELVRGYGQHNSRRMRQESPGGDAIEVEDVRKMLQLIERQLPPREAEAVIRRHVYGDDVSDGAREMNVDTRTFSRYLSRARRRIRRLFGKGKKDE